MDNREKASNLFKYIKDLQIHQNQVVTNLKKQEWYKFINTLPLDDGNIRINFFDRTADDQEEFCSTILSITKPEFEKVPPLPITLENWIEGDWTRYDKEIKIKEKREVVSDGEIIDILFSEDLDRMTDFKNWENKRCAWCRRQKKISLIRDLFNEFYKEYIELDRDTESYELMLGQGILECQTSDNHEVYHPILLKRVSMNFDAKNNKILIHDTDTLSEIYTFLFQDIEDINHTAIKDLKNELSEYNYHPLDRNDTPDFLKSFAHKLHVSSVYSSENKKPDTHTKIVIYNNPVLFRRKRSNGVLKALDDIVNQISHGALISGPILNLLGEPVPQYNSNQNQLNLNQSLASINGESKEILLSKEANQEQLEVARQIENYNAILVQGPPGTGKTHTIANLMGHFLAQGKTILVTSHTKKALNVVKEKVVKELQNLCVSALDDSNLDMERSIDGITEYLSSHTSSELFKTAEELKEQRNQILDELTQVRTKLYTIKHKEYETIVIGGKSYTMAEAANFVYENKEELSYIPGRVVLNQPLPLPLEDLEKLYALNEQLSVEEENELACPLPDSSLLIDPTDFKNYINDYQLTIDKINQLINETQNSQISIDIVNHSIKLDHKIVINQVDEEKINQLHQFFSHHRNSNLKKWQLKAILDGKNGSGHKEMWCELVRTIQSTNKFSGEILMTTFTKTLNSKVPVTKETITILNDIKAYLDSGKNLSFVSLLLHKDWKSIYENITINDKKIKNAEDCTILIQLIELKLMRDRIKTLWRKLIEENEGETISGFSDTFEQECSYYVSEIEFYLNWYSDIYQMIVTLLHELGLDAYLLNERNESIFPLEEINKSFSFVYNELPPYIQLIRTFYVELPKIESTIQPSLEILRKNELVSSSLSQNLAANLIDKNGESYLKNYLTLKELSQKRKYYTLRKIYLEEIEKTAPEWANMIRKRIGIHGECYLPTYIDQAWMWKQFDGIIEEITAEPFKELQEKEVFLNDNLRKSTAKLTETLAWGHLLERIEKDVNKKQDLQGWKLTTKRIGKGTGKRAPGLKREAQKLMVSCQSAVPAWIMPINKALETLDMRENKFDIVIIDEASQAEISTLAIMYLAKKIIIVGDDEQVSPSAIGLETDKVETLSAMYIKGSIPNSHLYDLKSSLYDIAKTTFPTIMLKEHFRCVPSIIGYCNRLSYDYKIKPLRDDSHVPVKPATIAYRVNGKRTHRKQNIEEAKTIVSLILSCMNQPEYDGMTFGVISLLGDEQVKLINNLCIEKISPQDYEERKILCGNAFQFQGDERDIIFISLVDSNEGDGPLRLVGEGPGKSIKQRYNVAVSRAKNQLWVIHSLDVNNDLKPGDFRKDLIEYVTNPSAFERQLEEIKEKADSPFEVSVASNLVKNGYNIIQQWPVGSYRIDMVAISGDKKIAIECDGELYHSGEDKVRQDMERQAILERIGWKFIRIRGSEYYKNPDKTLKRVIKELQNNGIEPECKNVKMEQKPEKLKERVIIEAQKLYNQFQSNEN